MANMKFNTPYIFYVDDLLDLYGHPRGYGFIYRDKGMVETEEMKRHRLEVLDAIIKNKEALVEVEEKMLNYVQEMIIQSPQVYVARTKDTKTDIEYFTAKTSWPLPGGQKKEIKIYLGKAEDFKNDTQNNKAKEVAVMKMKETLRRRKDSGEI